MGVESLPNATELTFLCESNDNALMTFSSAWLPPLTWVFSYDRSTTPPHSCKGDQRNYTTGNARDADGRKPSAYNKKPSASSRRRTTSAVGVRGVAPTRRHLTVSVSAPDADGLWLLIIFIFWFFLNFFNSFYLYFEIFNLVTYLILNCTLNYMLKYLSWSNFPFSHPYSDCSSPSMLNFWVPSKLVSKWEIRIYWY